jgi:hypothetical protein
MARLPQGKEHRTSGLWHELKIDDGTGRNQNSLQDVIPATIETRAQDAAITKFLGDKLVRDLHADLAKSGGVSSVQSLRIPVVKQTRSPNSFWRLQALAKPRKRRLPHTQHTAIQQMSGVSTGRSSVVPHLPIRRIGQLADFFAAKRQYRPVDQLVPNS